MLYARSSKDSPQTEAKQKAQQQGKQNLVTPYNFDELNFDSPTRGLVNIDHEIQNKKKSQPVFQNQSKEADVNNRFTLQPKEPFINDGVQLPQDGGKIIVYDASGNKVQTPGDPMQWQLEKGLQQSKVFTRPSQQGSRISEDSATYCLLYGQEPVSQGTLSLNQNIQQNEQNRLSTQQSQEICRSDLTSLNQLDQQNHENQNGKPSKQPFQQNEEDLRNNIFKALSWKSFDNLSQQRQQSAKNDAINNQSSSKDKKENNAGHQKTRGISLNKRLALRKARQQRKRSRSQSKDWVEDFGNRIQALRGNSQAQKPNDSQTQNFNNSQSENFNHSPMQNLTDGSKVNELNGSNLQQSQDATKGSALGKTMQQPNTALENKNKEQQLDSQRAIDQRELYKRGKNNTQRQSQVSELLSQLSDPQDNARLSLLTQESNRDNVEYSELRQAIKQFQSQKKKRKQQKFRVTSSQKVTQGSNTHQRDRQVPRVGFRDQGRGIQKQRQDGLNRNHNFKPRQRRRNSDNRKRGDNVQAGSYYDADKQAGNALNLDTGSVNQQLINQFKQQGQNQAAQRDKVKQIVTNKNQLLQITERQK